jgi:hypothetical protein
MYSELDISSMFGIGPSASTRILQTQGFENEFARRYTQVIGGVELKLGGAFSLGAEGRFGRDGVDFRTRFTVLLF